jgi:glycosyltransferase involved in cell wall biosynthesis
VYSIKKIKILECIRQGQIGGGESHLLSVVENLDRNRFDPIVLSFTDGPMIKRLREMRIDTKVIYTEKPFDITKWRKIRNLLKDSQVDLVHAHGTRAGSNIMWAAKSLNIPVIYTIHGWSFHSDQHPFVRSMRILGEKYLTSRADVNISVSASNKQSGVDHLGRFEALVINNGIDRKKFSPGNLSKNIRQELGIDANALLVLFLARFTAHKQPLILLNAFREALKLVSDLHLLMVGDGDQKQEALEWVKLWGLEDKITFQPFRQDVPDILAAADIFVLPSLWEGLPIGLLEAMAMGKAVIATNVDGTKEVVRDQVNGLLIEAGNIPALTKAMIRLAMDQSLRLAFSQKALETIQQQFDAVNMTRKIEDVYLGLYKRKTHSASVN